MYQTSREHLVRRIIRRLFIRCVVCGKPSDVTYRSPEGDQTLCNDHLRQIIFPDFD